MSPRPSSPVDVLPERMLSLGIADPPAAAKDAVQTQNAMFKPLSLRSRSSSYSSTSSTAARERERGTKPKKTDGWKGKKPTKRGCPLKSSRMMIMAQRIFGEGGAVPPEEEVGPVGTAEVFDHVIIIHGVASSVCMGGRVS